MDKRLLLVVFLFLSSCGKKEGVTHFRKVAMTIPYHIQIGDNLSISQTKKAHRIIDHTFEEIDNTFNHWNPQSEISLINRLPVNVEVLISNGLRELLELSKQVHRLSQGRFDPTYGHCISRWKGALLSAELPAPSRFPCGFSAISLQGNSIEKMKPLHIDLDGIAKGFAVDLLINSLKEASYQNIYVNWGGEIRTTGAHPSGRPWQVLVGSTGKVTPLQEKAIATSGNSMQYREIDGTIYSHFIDTKTHAALPQKKSRSITVLAPTCAMADALATAAMLFEDEEELASWKSAICANNPSIEFI